MGLAVTRTYGVPGAGTSLVSFSIPGLQLLDSVKQKSASEVSVTVSCGGHKVYVRNGDAIQGFTLDSGTGVLGHAPFLTIAGVSIAHLFTFYGSALGISQDGGRLFASEPAGRSSSGAPSKITYFDALTGARVGAAQINGLVNPTLVGGFSCGAVGFGLNIRHPAFGLSQISWSGVFGQKYELQKSQNLVTWEKLLEFQMSAAPEPFTDVECKTTSVRFYRLKFDSLKLERPYQSPRLIPRAREVITSFPSGGTVFKRPTASPRSTDPTEGPTNATILPN